MLVSHRHRFIYTKTVKTAGSSVESYFDRFCMPPAEWALTHHRPAYISDFGIVGFRGPPISPTPDRGPWWSHMPAALIREQIGEEVWGSYFKFCVIRNPYDKAVSAFYFYRSYNRSKNDGSDECYGSEEWGDLDRMRAEFEAWLPSGQLPIDRDKYLIDGQFCLDDVIRYEALAKDLERICARLGVVWHPASLPHFKSGYRPGNQSIESLYTDKSKSMVESAYAFELAYFGYSFPAGV